MTNKEKRRTRFERIRARLKSINWPKTLTWVCTITWISIFAIFVTMLFYYDFVEFPLAEKVGDLKIFGPEKATYVLWERKEVISFSFTQITTSINYLFVASAAILGFVVNMLITPEKKKVNKIPREAVVLLKHTAIGCLLSIFYGYHALTSFENLGDSDSFSIYQEMLPGASAQLFTFLITVLILILAAHFIVKGRRSEPSAATYSKETEP